MYFILKHPYRGFKGSKYALLNQKLRKSAITTPLPTTTSTAPTTTEDPFFSSDDDIFSDFDDAFEGEFFDNNQRSSFQFVAQIICSNF